MFNKNIVSNCGISNIDIYDYYIAIDWSQKNMAVAVIRKHSNKPKVIDVSSDVEYLKDYLNCLKGKKILTIEETTSSHWLYVELYNHADRILICDPYRNRLLSDGPKTDKIDAIKLCMLLKSGLLKEVYHSLEKTFELRQLESSYEQLVKSGVREKNQKSAIYRAEGKSYKEKEEIGKEMLEWVIQMQDERLELYKRHKSEYENKFREISRNNQSLKNLQEVNGIGLIGAVKLLANIIDAKRFENSGKYLSYCGLIKHEKLSGGRSYGRKITRYCRNLKSVYKTAALVVTRCNCPLKDYYKTLIKNGLSEDKARNKIARQLAVTTYGMLKTGTKYNPYKWRKSLQEENK